jgi:hypothetical protein
MDDLDVREPGAQSFESMIYPFRGANNELTNELLALGPHLERLETAAGAFTRGLRRRGRPRNSAIHEAIQDLRQLWDENSTTAAKLSYSKKAGTTGSFLRFCEIILQPALREVDSPPQLEGAVRKALYGAKRRPSRRK